jgi:hypothetical protein
MKELPPELLSREPERFRPGCPRGLEGESAAEFHLARWVQL